MSAFQDRHIGLTQADRERIARLLGYRDTAAVIDAALPAAIREREPLDLGEPMSEPEVIAHLRRIAALNRPLRTFIGQGYYGTHMPTPILRNVLENPAWYTSYTPYQPEISQGRLEALLNFQTMVADLTGLDIAGASLLDEATAAAEAMALMHRSHRGDADCLLVDHLTHPQVLEVLRTRMAPLGLRLVVVDPLEDLDFKPAFGLLLSQPGTDGRLRALDGVIADAHSNGLLVTMLVDLLASVLLRSAGEQGADIAVGSAQRFGVPMAFGGPHAAFIAVRQGLERGLPGRLVGVSVDVHGNAAYRLALQTREQHIRREKATSNICTAQALLAILASMYAVYHGWEGLSEIAARVNRMALRAERALSDAGWSTRGSELFDTVSFAHPEGSARALELAERVGFNIRALDGVWAAFSLDETATDSEVDALLSALGAQPADGADELGASWLRGAPALAHPVFEQHRTETELMRYLRRLADLDLALDRTMIPLGSCTMKLNAATEMLAITWPEFADVHPYAPLDQAEGWLQLIGELERDLAEVTGYDQVTLQPNAGSQGEFAGLLAITRYHRSRGEGERDVCLIPSSAHGTNAASAAMAGLRVVVVGCDERGNVDLEDLRAKIGEHASNLAAIMLTYPSTHGVYESEVAQICAEVHAAGGQVYVDGANLNALVGLARPGRFGSDVSHLNLHKTFAIPHGGGGPGVGPVGVREHLAQFLPGDPLAVESGAVAAARYGSAGVLPISYAYLKLMGGAGLTLATESAVLAANYVAKRLGETFPVLYTNERGLVAHECILDLRPLTKATGVSVDDVAKRLIDYGFHAPTMSFPVAGTLMVEPTESESLAELDRFVDAMLAIGAEARDIEEGRVAYADSALKSAPHTAASLLASDLGAERRLAAALPPGVDARTKYWPPVGRIDGAYGDRNLVCSCPPVEDFAR